MGVEDQLDHQVDFQNNRINFNLTNNLLNSIIWCLRIIKIKEDLKNQWKGQVTSFIATRSKNRIDNHKQWKPKSSMLLSYSSKLLRNSNKRRLRSQMLLAVFHLQQGWHLGVLKPVAQLLSNLLTTMIQNFKKYYKRKEKSTREN